MTTNNLAISIDELNSIFELYAHVPPKTIIKIIIDSIFENKKTEKQLRDAEIIAVYKNYRHTGHSRERSLRFIKQKHQYLTEKYIAKLVGSHL